MKRRLYDKLLEWKVKDGRKPLVILGARQVGKTWLMKEFGKREYKNTVYINCDDEPRMKDLFVADYDISRILLGLQAISGQSINAEDTLIIFDEIQEVQRGLHSLKYFCENAPQYHVMAAGSLLGVTLGQNESFPVGKVDILKLYPLDYGEFLAAVGGEQLEGLLENKDWSLIDMMGSKYVEYLRQYYFVGGMPEAVLGFVDKMDLNAVRTIQRNILEAYRIDMSKHVTKKESVRIGQVFSSLPSQLAKENKKFIYGVMRSGARASEFELAIQWLVDAGLVYKVNRVKVPKMPLKFYEEESVFKLFVLDCGLLGCMADVPPSKLLVGDEGFVEYKGAMTENYLAQQLVALGVTPFYWSNDRSTAEIDFLVQYHDRVIPIEVKAETNVRSRSLAQVIKDNPDLKGLRFSMRGYVDQEWMENVPLYAVGTVF